MKYVLTKRRCYRRAGRYIRLQDFLTNRFFSRGHYFGKVVTFQLKVFDVSTIVFFRNLLSKTMPKYAVKLSNVVLVSSCDCLQFPTYYVYNLMYVHLTYQTIAC